MNDPSGRPAAFYTLTVAGILIGASSIPGSAPGINITTTGAVAMAAIWSVRRGPLTRSSYILIALIPALLIFVSVRSATWVVALDLLSVVVVASVALAPPGGWLEVSMSTPRTIANLPRGIAIILGPLAKKTADGLRLTPVIRTLAMIGIALFVFGGLFVSADPAFASIVEEFLIRPLNVSLLPVRLATALGVTALIGSLTLEPPGTDTVAAQGPTERRMRLGGAEWKVTLVLVDLLFAGFVVVQLTVLFAGDDHVLRTTGLTYAEYARQGFFQLIIAAALTLGVIGAALRVHSARESDRAWLRGLLGTLCVLTIVILASASKRMGLYQEAYGFTRLRLLVDMIILLLGATFVLLLVAGVMWKGAWLPRAVVVLCASAVIGFNFYNPDARIAEQNIDRFFQGGEIDVHYLAGLSADAVPKLAELPEPERSCVLGRLDEVLARPEPIWSWNSARIRAREVLRELPAPECLR